MFKIALTTEMLGGLYLCKAWGASPPLPLEEKIFAKFLRPAH